MLGRDGVAGLICLAGSLTLLWASRGLPQPALVPVGPAFYPRVLLALTAALATALVVSDFLRRERLPVPSVRYRLVLFTFVIFTLYVFVMPWLGYRLATFLFVAALQATLDPPSRPRGWIVIGVFALVVVVLTYYVFEVYLHVLLPRGRLTGF